MNATILLASPSIDRLGAWQHGLQGFTSVTAVSTFPAIGEHLVQDAPDVVLLDTELFGLDGTINVAKLALSFKGTRFLALSPEADDDKELALFRSGVRGCCRSDIDPQTLKSVVMAIHQGEVWIRRTLTPRLLEELGARMRNQDDETQAAVLRLAELTRREREIAELIGNGESNKQIARILTITERTVKAHLTEIFRKVGLADRVRLALLMLNSSKI